MPVINNYRTIWNHIIRVQSKLVPLLTYGSYQSGSQLVPLPIWLPIGKFILPLFRNTCHIEVKIRVLIWFLFGHSAVGSNMFSTRGIAGAGCLGSKHAHFLYCSRSCIMHRCSLQTLKTSILDCSISIWCTRQEQLNRHFARGVILLCAAVLIDDKQQP